MAARPGRIPRTSSRSRWVRSATRRPASWSGATPRSSTASPDRARMMIVRALLLCAALLLGGGAAAQTFYQDRSVKLIISDTGGYDAEARLLARHLPKHIPGRPSIVVMNMPGAGGLTGANYV